MNSKAMVITAGFEKPDKASEGDKYPRSSKIVNSNIAVTSILNNSVINRTIPDPRMARTIAIEDVMVNNLKL